MEDHSFLRNAIIYLLAAVTAVPVFKRLGLGSVLGYLVAGVCIGPSALGLIHSPQEVLHFSELGVVLLLFLIGLELNPSRLWQLRKPIFGVGGAQVSLSILVLIPGFIFLGIQGKSAWIAAMGFAMSSTALALQILDEKNLRRIPIGEASFGVLLFQDLAVIPMLALLPFLVPETAESISQLEGTARGWVALKGFSVIAGVILSGRFLLRPLFRVIAETELREIFTAFSLVLILGIAYLMQSVGLSMALGSFLAGVLLADSEFRHELEIDIEPFKGLLLGLFFIAVGMSIDLSILVSGWPQVIALVIACITLKGIALYAVARMSGYTNHEAILFGLALSQGGEFAFVLYGVARQFHIMDESSIALLNVSIVFSMAATPLLFMVYEKWILPLLQSQGTPRQEYSVQAEGNAVILAGFGRIGQVVGRLLHSQKIGVTILEQDPSQIEIVRRFGWKTYYGDVSRLDLLRAAGAETAKLLVIAIDDMDATVRTIKIVKEHFPHLKIIVRAESRMDAYRFINLGIPTVRATFAPGLELGEEALKLLGYPAYESHVIGKRFQRYDRAQLLRSAPHHEDERTMISIAKETREELNRIMESDESRRSELATDGWG